MNITAHEQWLSEMKNAALRLRQFKDENGESNLQKPGDAVIRWALSLARLPLDDLSESDFRNLQGELTCFSTFELTEPYLRKGVITPGPLLGREEIAHTHKWLRMMVEAIRLHNPLYFIAPQREWFAVYSTEEQRWKTTYIEDTIVGPGAAPLFDLFRGRLDDLRPCKRSDCGQLFLRDRSRQLYCSKRHQWVDAQRTAQGIAPERYGKRGRPPRMAKPKARKREHAKGIKRRNLKPISTKRK